MRVIAVAGAGLALAALLGGCTPEMQETPTVAAGTAAPAGTGAGDYARLCASCHGPEGRGDGPAASGLPTRPADLTRIARRAGGTYPRLQVMSRIYGYTMGSSDTHMPQFGELLEGPTVLYDPGDGIRTPTPARLVALQQYLETLQR